MASLEQALDTLAASEGVRAVVVAGRDGLLIHGVARGNREDLEAVAAMSAGVVASMQSLATDVGRGTLDQVIAEFGDTTVLLHPLGDDATLAVLAGPEGNLGRLRFLLRRRAADVGHLVAEL